MVYKYYVWRERLISGLDISAAAVGDEFFSPEDAFEVADKLQEASKDPDDYFTVTVTRSED